MILVTGGAGCIGFNLCKILLEQDHKVIAIDNLITGSVENLKQLKHYPKFKFIPHDITKPFPKNFEFRLSNFEFMYHLACPTGVSNLARLGEEMLLTCSQGTKNILELARTHHAKLLFTSSSEVYGNPKSFPQTEEYTGNVDPTGFRSPYEEGKRFAESLVVAYVRKYNIDAKIVRIFNTYGPGMSNKDTRVIPQFLHQALSGKPLTVEGKGVQTRTFCYVDDLVEGLILVTQKGGKGEVYNLGSDKEMTVIELAKLVIRLTDSRSKIRFVPRPTHDHNRRHPDLTKIKKLGWEPKLSLEEGLKKTLELYTAR